ncbi:alpha/beta hydrolase [Phyllobacterium sp. YR531]|uniref:alpha/beta fold hydrolase n=1 Tax=Phyllobacterium sp. YR531 TaxID=1144343 RepID=UPI00026F8707|nr:alpha/beta hydrolase [Phyllobacterium sp. YR531]EJN04029.1 putative hydrolase or acyltransferase of alpha/beta superfamily [Phyllobacterium sp. YR531]
MTDRICAACGDALYTTTIELDIDNEVVEACSDQCAEQIIKNNKSYKPQFEAAKKYVDTSSGRIYYAESGEGPVALFVHGVLVNSYLWRHQLAGLSDIRRCIAIDTLAHGATEAIAGQDLSTAAQADMLVQFLDALQIEQVDLVGNDGGGAVCQIFAVNNPGRVRSLTLTDCDTHDNWPPVAFQGFVNMCASGGLRGTLTAMVSDKNIFRSPDALGPCYENTESISDDTIDAYLQPYLSKPGGVGGLERFVAAFDCSQTVAIESKLRQLQVPTLIVWATDDVYFDKKWAHWLAEHIPGTRKVVELEGARLFFPEERFASFNDELRAHWS